MATSTMPAAIDYLFTAISALPECAAPVVVCDGWPDKDGPSGVVIGITPDDDATNADLTHAELGARAKWEEYDIPCHIWAHAAGGDRPMKAARDAAFAIFDAIDTHLRTPTGMTLGGVLHSEVAYIVRAPLEQTDSADEAGAGRVARIPFTVRCKSRSVA